MMRFGWVVLFTHEMAAHFFQMQSGGTGKAGVIIDSYDARSLFD
jgi:hypothetical protein